MTTHTWFGGTGRFGNPNDWTPNGVPQSGDTAIIETGKVKLANTGQGGVTIDLNGTSADTAPVLSLRNDVLADNIVMTGLQTRFGEIDIHGTVVDKGSMTIGGGRFTGGADLTINIRGNGTLLSEGPITVDLAGVTIKGGTWEANTVTNFGQIMNIDTKVTAGTFTAPPTVFESGFHFGESVAAGVHVVLSGLAVPQEVIIDKPLQFLGEIDGF